MFFFQVVVDVDDVGHGAGQRQRLLEAGTGVEEDGGAADLTQHVVATRVGIDEVADDRALVTLRQQVLLELINAPI